MEIEQAIQTALQYEERIRDLYIKAMKDAKSDAGRKVFRVLAKEEQIHIDYLEVRLVEWKKDKKINIEKLQTLIPSTKEIDKEIEKLPTDFGKEQKHLEITLLQQALELETATSNFYKQMSAELKEDAQIMFSNFLKIEENHRAIVLAEMDSLNGMGFWLHVREFDLEG